MLAFTLCLAATIVLMLLMERLVRPRVDTRGLIRRVRLLAAMPAVVFYVTMFMISYRPVFSLAAAVIVFAAIIVINNAKFAALKEPLVFSDFALLREAINHPRLYVKYIGVWNIVGILVTGAIAIVGAIAAEPPVIVRQSLGDFFPSLIYLATVVGLIYAITRGPLRGAFSQLLRRFGPTTDIRRDIDNLSLIVCLIFYFFMANERAQLPAPAGERPPAEPRGDGEPPRRPPGPFADLSLPTVVAVQSESFFDARRLHPSIDRSVLARYDACANRASYRGRLTVPAWGANTMRTEFAFLSGLPNEALGVHRFNPYLSLCKRPSWTIAHQLRAIGYRTVCVHPFHADFFDRKTVFPNLGFDLFLDIHDFQGADTFGPYISDEAVADKIIEVLGAWSGPQFVFAITMENHGKWEARRLDGLAGAPPPGYAPLGSPELGLYLAHLRNTDAMTHKLVRELKRRPEDAVFCLFGDHVPSLPRVFKKVGFDDPRTDYFVWRKGGRHPRQLDTSADVLGRLLLDAVFNSANHEAIETIAAHVPATA